MGWCLRFRINQRAPAGERVGRWEGRRLWARLFQILSASSSIVFLSLFLFSMLDIMLME